MRYCAPFLQPLHRNFDMKEYITTDRIKLFHGRIGMDDKQAARREHQVRKIPGSKDIFEIVSPVSFKRGEIIRLADPDKLIRTKVELTDPEKTGKKDPDPEKTGKKNPDTGSGGMEDAMEDYIIAAEQAIEAGLVTASGAPEVRAMEEILNCNITAEDRDAAWAALKVLNDNSGAN